MKNRLRVFALILLLFNGLSALLGGYGFLADPSGAGVGMSLAYLEHSPFSDYLIPGLVLFTAIGVFSLVAAYALVRHLRGFSTLILTEGLLLIGWIAIQMMLIREVNGLHATFGTVGGLLVWLGLKFRHLPQGNSSTTPGRARPTTLAR